MGNYVKFNSKERSIKWGMEGQVYACKGIEALDCLAILLL